MKVLSYSAFTLVLTVFPAFATQQQSPDQTPNSQNSQDVPKQQPKTNDPDVGKQRKPATTPSTGDAQRQADVPQQKPGTNNPDVGKQRHPKPKKDKKETSTSSTQQ